MPLSLAEKKQVVAELADVAANAHSVVVADYRGLTVSEMTQLRADARQKGVTLSVVRNTLSRRAFEGTAFDCLREVLVGPLCLAFSQEEPGAAARLLRDFAKENEQIEVKALSIDGELLTADQLELIASLPTREEALTKLVVVMKAPVSKFARTLTETYAKLVRTLAAVGDKKQSAE